MPHPLFFESVTSRQRDEERSVSRRSANVWPGPLVVCVCQQKRDGGRRGWGGSCEGPAETREQGDPRWPFPASTLSASLLLFFLLP